MIDRKPPRNRLFEDFWNFLLRRLSAASRILGAVVGSSFSLDSQSVEAKNQADIGLSLFGLAKNYTQEEKNARVLAAAGEQ